MRKVNVLTPEEAVNLIKDGDTVVTEGFVSSTCPETITSALEKKFLETGSPRDLTYVYAGGQGNRDGRGCDHFAHEGLVKRAIGGHWDRGPKLCAMAIENKIEAYNLPQGIISHLFRDIAAKKLGTLTHTGLYTFVDPRNGGGKLNPRTTEDMVILLNIEGQERLLYKAFPINACLIKGTYADESGNITMEKEIATFDTTAIAQATKNSGGKVIVQVERIVENGSLDPKLVKIPGIYVDAVVIGTEEDSQQCIGYPYDGSMTGEYRNPKGEFAPIPFNTKKIIARRAAMELTENSVANLGVGVPELVSAIAAEEGIGDFMTLTVESGPIGGFPKAGAQFGGATNVECILDQNQQFDFYHGGGLDLAFLGLAEADEEGNINVSKFGTRLSGSGGFIDITQNAKKVFFCGTFTAGGLKTSVQDGKLIIEQEGKVSKFVKAVQHITFSGIYARKVKQPVRYLTERAVFELQEDGLHLIEIAPGINLQTQILDLMDFKPIISEEPKLMDARLFLEEPMGLDKDKI